MWSTIIRIQLIYFRCCNQKIFKIFGLEKSSIYTPVNGEELVRKPADVFSPVVP